MKSTPVSAGGFVNEQAGVGKHLVFPHAGFLFLSCVRSSRAIETKMRPGSFATRARIPSFQAALLNTIPPHADSRPSSARSNHLR